MFKFPHSKPEAAAPVVAKTLTGTVIDLSNISGNNYNYAAPSAATSYTTVTPIINGAARCFVNAATEPVVTNAIKIKGATFVGGALMEMVVSSPDGTAVQYYFIEL